MRRILLLMLILLMILPVAAAQQPDTNPPERSHLVRDGDNLYNIAARYSVTVASIADLNGITDYNSIRIGQRLRIPGGTSPLAPPAPNAQQAAVQEVTPVPGNAASSVGFAYGIETSLLGADANNILPHLQTLGVGWVKHVIDWSLYEPSQGVYNWQILDVILPALDQNGYSILLTVTNALGWARESTLDQGPPVAYEDYAAFIGQLAARYKGVVNAYEIWNEPNLRANWTGKPISGTEYANLFKLASNAVKTADPAAIVVTAGLAPTATNDGVNAVADRVFLEQMYQAGIAPFADAIGAHPGGYANPPDSVCCGNNRPAVSGWDDQEAFFFMEALRDYREILNQHDDSGTFLWVTSFGWGSADGITTALNPDIGFVEFTDSQEQAQYIVRAYQLARDLSYVGPMFLNNLNYCSALARNGVECYWSILDAAGQPRPAYNALQVLTP